MGHRRIPSVSSVDGSESFVAAFDDLPEEVLRLRAVAEARGEMQGGVVSLTLAVPAAPTPGPGPHDFWGV